MPTPPRKRRWLTHANAVLLPLGTLVALTIVWEAVVRLFSIPSFLLPAPSAIAVDSLAAMPQLLMHTKSTLVTIMLGFVVSILVSFPLGILLASSRVAANTLYPLLVMTQSVPKVAIAPILVIALGSGELPRVVVTVLIAFFPLVMSITAGLKSVPEELIEFGRSLRATPMQMLFRIKLPYAVPIIFNGLKLAMTFCAVGAVVGEFIAADKGLGYQIVSAMGFFKTMLAFGALIILSLLSIALFQLIAIAERVFFPWATKADES